MIFPGLVSKFAILGLLSSAALAQAQTTARPVALNPPQIPILANATQCQNVTATWSDVGLNSNKAIAYIAVIVDADNITGSIRSDLVYTYLYAGNATNTTWECMLPAGANVSLRVSDWRGSVGYSAPVLVQNSTDTACLSQAGINTTTTAMGVVKTRA